MKKSQLQLVGVTAMFIASKYEELFPPGVNDYVYITDDAYTNGEMRALECLMLKKLGYSFGNPLPPHFLRRNSRAGNVSKTSKKLMEGSFNLCTSVCNDTVF